MSDFTYEYNPFYSQKREEIPNFTIYEGDEKVAETNENMTSEKQEDIAILFTHANEMLELLRDIYPFAITEGFDMEWISQTSTLLNKFNLRAGNLPHDTFSDENL